MTIVLLEISALEEILGRAYVFFTSIVGILIVVGALLLVFSLLNLYTIASEMKKIRMLFEDITIADEENPNNIKLNLGSKSMKNEDSVEDSFREVIFELENKLNETENEQSQIEIKSMIDKLKQIIGSR